MKIQKSAKNKYFFTLGSVLAYFVTLILFSALVLSALYKQYYEISLSADSFSSESFTKKLSRYAKFGINPNRVEGLDVAVLEYFETTNAYRVLVLDQNKNIIKKVEYAEDKILIPQKTTSLPNGSLTFEENDTTWILSEIIDNDKKPVGYLLHGIFSNRFLYPLEELINNNMSSLLTICIGFLLLLIILCQLVTRSEKIQNHPKKKLFLYTVLLIPFISAQALFIFTLYEPIRKIQETSISSIATGLSNEIATDIKNIQKLQVPLSLIGDIEEYFQEFQNNFSWLEGIKIQEPNFVLEVIKNQDKNVSLEANSLTGQTLWNNDDNQTSSVTIYVPSDTIWKTSFEILLDVGTVTVITFVMLMEFLSMVLLKEEHNLNLGEKVSLYDDATIMRPIIFICMFAISLSISFIPLRMAEISTNVFGLSQDISIGLPVSVEMFCVGFAIMIGGSISHKIGWRPLLVWGCFLVSLGAFLSAFANISITFLFARSIAGFGYGSINLAAQLFVISKSNTKNRTTNIAFMVAGLCAGVLCGSAFGGLIADRLGYSSVFFTAGACMFLTFIYLFLILPKSANNITNIDTYIKNASKNKLFNFTKINSPVPINLITPPIDLSSAQENAIQKNVVKLNSPLGFEEYNQINNKVTKKNTFILVDIIKLCLNYRMASLLFLNIMPCALITVCLFQFYIPVSLNEAGVNPAGIGRVSMFFSLMIVYLGPILGKYIDNANKNINIANQANRKAYWLCLAGILAASSLIVLSISNNVFFAICSVTFLGCANAIVYSAQGSYALELPISETIGSEKTISIYNVAERLGQVLGPISLGLAISIWGAIYSLQIFAATLIIMTIFLFFSAKPKKS